VSAGLSWDQGRQECDESDSREGELNGTAKFIYLGRLFPLLNCVWVNGQDSKEEIFDVFLYHNAGQTSRP